MNEQEIQECKDRLAEAKAALHELEIGGAVAEVWHGDQRMRYTPANKPSLVQYIGQLESRCGNCPGRGARRSIGVIF